MLYTYVYECTLFSKKASEYPIHVPTERSLQGRIKKLIFLFEWYTYIHMKCIECLHMCEVRACFLQDKKQVFFWS